MLCNGEIDIKETSTAGSGRVGEISLGILACRVMGGEQFSKFELPPTTLELKQGYIQKGHTKKQDPYDHSNTAHSFPAFCTTRIRPSSRS
jgi:hypothetical protein